MKKGVFFVAVLAFLIFAANAQAYFESVLGLSAPPVCNDTVPQGAPFLRVSSTGTNSVALSWSQGEGPMSYYLVAYGTSRGVPQYGNANIGGQGTTSYTVSGLSGGRTYYFKVRAGNGCAPGPYSNEVSATPGGAVLTGVVAEGFAEGVLGAEEDTSKVSTPEDEFNKLEEKNTGSVLGSFFAGGWVKALVVLAGLMAVAIPLYYIRKNSGGDKPPSSNPLT